MLLVILLAIFGITFIWAGYYIHKHEQPPRGSLMFWIALLARIFGWLLVILAVAGVIAFFLLPWIS